MRLIKFQSLILTNSILLISVFMAIINQWYLLFEVLVSLVAFFGNIISIIVFIQDKRLRKVTNFYIISLSFADLLVGLIGIPSAIFIKIGVPRTSFSQCLTIVSLLVAFCTISILNLVAVSLDRFWAILYPLNYHRRMSSKFILLPQLLDNLSNQLIKISIF